jgi:hypothetical protein
MLQAIHQKKTAPRASSIYCRWIRENRREGERLVAVWIDNEMRCFERELVENSEGEATRQDALEEPGRAAFLES